MSVFYFKFGVILNLTISNKYFRLKINDVLSDENYINANNAVYSNCNKT